MKIQIELTDDELEAILLTAGEHGSGYWARTEHALVKALSRPAGVRIYDAEKVPRHAGTMPESAWLGTLTRKGLEGAATKLAELATRKGEGKRVLAALIEDPALLDGLEADAFVQVAVFGEIRYG